MAITSQRQPVGSYAEPMPETVERIDFARQQEIQCWKVRFLCMCICVCVCVCVCGNCVELVHDKMCGSPLQQHSLFM